MKTKFAILAGLAVAATTMTASADLLLQVDLSVTDQLTMTATDGLSAATEAGSDSIGVLLADFFNDASFSSGDTLVSGDLTSAENSSDGTPDLFSSTSSFGLNFWSWTADASSTFTAGEVAFTGSATWSISSSVYAAMLAGNTSGDLYFPADTDDDIPGATYLGTWEVVVPAPGAMALLGLGGIAATRRRRR